MQPSFLSIATLLMSMGFSAADFSSSSMAVKNCADKVKEKIDGWSAKDGLSAALEIQNLFSDLSTSVTSLSSEASKEKDDELKVNDVQTLASSINNLLMSLNRKASDFEQVGAKDIVGNDISSISKPTLDIVNSLIKVVSNDCSKATTLKPSLRSLGSNFNMANSAFGQPKMNFPAEIPCNANKDTQNPVSSTASSSSSQPGLITVYSTAYATGPIPSSSGSSAAKTTSSSSEVPSMGGMSMGGMPMQSQATTNSEVTSASSTAESSASLEPMPSGPFPFISAPSGGIPIASSTSASSSSAPSITDSGIIPPGIANPMATSSKPSMGPSNSTGESSDTNSGLPLNAPMPFNFPNHNGSDSSSNQPSVSMSNGANSISGNAVIAIAAVGAGVSLLL